MHDDIDWNVERIDNSRPPLRWIANLFGEISGWAVMRLSYAEEYDHKIKSKIYEIIFDKTWPLYSKYGTFYKMNWDEEDYS
jgi:hypothetical protein